MPGLCRAGQKNGSPAPAMGRESPRYHPYYRPPSGRSLFSHNAGPRRDSSPRKRRLGLRRLSWLAAGAACLFPGPGASHRPAPLWWGENGIFSALLFYPAIISLPRPAVNSPGGEKSRPLPGKTGKSPYSSPASSPWAAWRKARAAAPPSSGVDSQSTVIQYWGLAPSPT